MGAIKGVGEAAIRSLVEVRKAGEIFTSFDDMVMRLPEKTLNKRVCEALVKAGAMGDMIPHMRSGLQGMSAALDEASRRRHDRLANQVGLFGVAEPSKDGNDLFPWLEVWDERECLQAEREVLGFYLTGHPLESYLHQVSGLADINLRQLPTCLDEAKVVIPVFVSAVREYRTARGTMAFVQLEDLHGRAEMVMFSKLYESCREMLQADAPLLLAAKVDASKEEPTLIAEAIILLKDVLPELVQRIILNVDGAVLNHESMAMLKGLSAGLSEESDTHVQWRFKVDLANGSIAQLESALPAPLWTNGVRRSLHERFGADAVLVQCAP